MKSRTTTLSLGLIAALFATAAVDAAEAHVHGIAALNLVADGESVFVELDSPAANMLGFEHQPGTPTEVAAVELLEQQLRQPQTLFEFSADAACQAMDAEFDMPFGEHSGEHDAEHEGEHAHDEAHHEAGHSDIRAEYRFVCAQPENLATLKVRLFELYPALQRVRVQTVVDTRQDATELTPDDAVLRF